MKVKICGITNPEDALLCENEGADALGFIFYKQSKRYISPGDASEIVKRLSPFTAKVGVFVNEEPAVINQIVKKVRLNAVQLHGDQGMDLISKIDCPVIKVFNVSDNFDFDRLKLFTGLPILLDTFSKDAYGGTGIQFNHSLIPESIRNKIILAGGISEDNLEDILSKFIPAAIDVSSSLEISPGKKSSAKVKSFFKKLNQLRK